MYVRGFSDCVRGFSGSHQPDSLQTGPSLPAHKTQGYIWIWAASQEKKSSPDSVESIFQCKYQAPQHGHIWLKGPFGVMLTWANSICSGETSRMRRLAWTLCFRICYKGSFPLMRLISAVRVTPEHPFSYGPTHLNTTIEECLKCTSILYLGMPIMSTAVYSNSFTDWQIM